jgi:hypothetical protein
LKLPRIIRSNVFLFSYFLICSVLIYFM